MCAVSLFLIGLWFQGSLDPKTFSKMRVEREIKKRSSNNMIHSNIQRERERERKRESERERVREREREREREKEKEREQEQREREMVLEYCVD